MRLFQALLRRKNMPHGNIYTGKHRIVKPVKRDDVQKLRNDFEIEEKNMFYLRHSFLTSEQSFGHAAALGKHENRMKELIMKKKDFKDNVTVESRLAHLRVKECWD
ncbi:unnamed protein product [Brassicogethes aeneus]|uniref:Ribosomal protein 63, mitochondrial n=1 Tax=Brassicogethes aeneus TaxID=1431903 RepID=A0A9P0AUH5_BRAAE|nr:unnamed protein product [Brassicogethes aeneus]